MTAGNQAWIQDSLTRLEQLESQREQLAATGRTEQLAELDEEIRSLYEALETAAEDEGEAANSPQWGAATTPPASPFAAAPVVAAPFAPTPFAAPPPSPFAAPASFAPAAPVVDYGSSSSMDDDVSSGSKGPIIAVALVALLGLGGAGWWYTNRTPPPPPPQAPVEAKVIGGAEIPPDTQDPNVAKGGDASRTPDQVFKERAQPEERRPASRPSSNNGPSRPREPEKPTRGPIKVGTSDDPLAGAN